VLFCAVITVIMAAKPLTFDDLYKMNKTQLIDTAAEFNITLTSAKRSEILTELLSKLPVPLDQPESVSKTLENYEDTDPGRANCYVAATRLTDASLV